MTQNKRVLYESIINSIAKQVKKAINEYGIVNYDLYNFATKVLEPLCEKYIKYAIWGKVTTRATQCKPGQDTHRASFTVTVKPIDNTKASPEKFKVTCKIYNQDKIDDTVAIDYNVIVEPYYKFIATIINNTVYYINIADIIKYQAQQGNRCVSRDGKFIYIAADYIIDKATYSADMEQDDIDTYNNGYNRYVKK